MKYKDAQLLNHALVTESLRLSRLVNESEGFLTRQRKTKRELLGNEGNYAQFASILSLAGMRPSGDFEVTESLGACVSRMNAIEIANNVEIADWIIGGGAGSRQR
ncbi:MAG: hypothetical protein LUD41_00365 [Phascolarctobacterium sp.]|nr:hypothetical protein [Phascolarctobacterium sp.]